MQFVCVSLIYIPSKTQIHPNYIRERRIATRYGMDGTGIQSRLVGNFPHPSSLAWCPPSLLYIGYWVFPGSKSAGAWRRPPITNWHRGWRKSRGTLLLPLWAFVICYRVKFILVDISSYLTENKICFDYVGHSLETVTEIIVSIAKGVQHKNL
jgi:hypothetical protein